MASGSLDVVDRVLLEAIVSLLPPAERFRLCPISKTMRTAVMESIFDIKKIAISHLNESTSKVQRVRCQLLMLDDNDQLVSIDNKTSDVQPGTKTSTGGCRVLMTTVNRYNGATATYDYKIAPSSLPSFLYSAGVWAKSLSVTTKCCFSSDHSRLETVQRVLEALNSEDKDACPKLMKLSMTSCRLVFDNKNILGDVRAYVRKRQKKANPNPPAGRPQLFLTSLSLIAESTCCNEDIVNMQMSRFNQSPAVNMDWTRDVLQQMLDQCKGLKVLNVDKLLMTKSKTLPVVALRYPTSLTHLKTTRLGKTPGELRAIVANCPHLQFVEDLNGGFTHVENDIRVLVSLSDLRALSIVSAATGDEMVQLDKLITAGFGEHPCGSSIVRPWTQITSIALNYVTSDFLQLLSRGCPTLQEVRIQVLANTEAVTTEMVGYLSDLPALRVLIVEGMKDQREVMVGNSLLDTIAGKCPHLEQLRLFPCSVSLLSLSELLRKCPSLRSVALRSLSIELETQDCLEMLENLARDLCDRKVAVIVRVKEIRGEDDTSMRRLRDGLGTDTVMAMSSMANSCASQVKMWASWRSDEAVGRAIVRRVEVDGLDTYSRSFILASRLRPQAAIVFSAPHRLR